MKCVQQVCNLTGLSIQDKVINQLHKKSLKKVKVTTIVKDGMSNSSLKFMTNAHSHSASTKYFIIGIAQFH